MTVRALRLASLIYLLLPAILFTLGWFNPLFSVPVLVAYGFLLVAAFRDQTDSAIILPFKDLLFLALLALVISFFTGIAGLSYQSHDHWGHNTKYYDLTMHAWPLFFPEKGQYATYYFNYYLVPALISKWLGHPSGSLLFAWTAVGFFLGLNWLFLVTGRPKVLLLLLPFLGGASLFVKIINVVAPGGIHLTLSRLGILSLFEQGQWTPNQLVSCLLVTGLLVYNAFERRKLEATFFPLTLTFLWGVFPAAFLTVLYGLMLLRKTTETPLLTFIRQALADHLVPCLAFLPVFVYLLSSDGLPVSGFFWKYDPLNMLTFSRYGLFVLVQLLLYGLCRYMLHRSPGPFPVWFVNLLFGLFFVTSHYKIGVNNDWLTRSEIPMVLLSGIIILRGLTLLLEQGQRRVVVTVSLLIVVANPALFLTVSHSLSRSFVAKQLSATANYHPIPYDRYPNTYQLLLKRHSLREAQQYLGKKNSLYERFLARH